MNSLKSTATSAKQRLGPGTGHSWRRNAVAGPSSAAGVREVHDYIRGSSSGDAGPSSSEGTFKLPLSNKSIVGVASSRGSRLYAISAIDLVTLANVDVSNGKLTSRYQEDRTKAVGLQLDPSEIRRNLKERLRTDWDPSKAGSGFMAGQTAYFGIFDGHGGEHVSKYISEHLHELFESVDPASIPDIIKYTKSHGDYFKRWGGGGLRRWMPDSVEGTPEEGSGMTFEERLVLAFLTADKRVLESIEESQRCGATATVALMHSLDEPAQAYWSADKLNLTIAHLGDTRAILHQTNGECLTLTENHHANSRIESARLLRMGTKNVVMDSYGESRWMGAVENTRSIGDGEYKPSGVTAEPEIRSQVLNGSDYACLVLVTDGLTSLISNQEICDLTRNAADPTKAAQAILKFAEDLDPQDNCTCMVIPLKGWGKVTGEDMTKERREYRRRQASQMSGRMRRM